MPLDLSSCFSSNGREMVPIVCDGKRDGIVLDAETSMPLRFYQPSSSHYFIPCLSDAVANGPNCPLVEWLSEYGRRLKNEWYPSFEVGDGLGKSIPELLPHKARTVSRKPLVASK